MAETHETAASSGPSQSVFGPRWRNDTITIQVQAVARQTTTCENSELPYVTSG